MYKELFDKGLKIRKEVLGQEYVEEGARRRRRIQHADAGDDDRDLLGLYLGP